jgi:outer membrane protein assembly factor BamB
MWLVRATGSDTLVVLDNQNRRISFIHPDEGFLGSVPMGEEVVGFPQAQGVFEDGALVMGGGAPRIVPGDLRNGIRRFPTYFRSYEPDGSLATDFGEYPGYELFMWVDAGGGPRSIGASVLPFGRTTVAAVTADRLYLGTQDSYEIRAYDPSGSLRSIIRLDQELRPLTSSDAAAYLERQLEGIDDPSRQAERRRQIEDMGMRETMPAHGNLAVDVLGHLWVSESRGPQDDSPAYTVFDAEGKLVGRLPVPRRFGVIEIGSDYVLGTYVDELDVEYVRVYRLRRGG